MLAMLTLQPVSAQNPAGLTLQIIPTEYSSRISPDASISFSTHGHFHVLLTNTSTTPLRFFEEWNSWGESALSFEITYPNGQTVRSQKRPQLLREKNAPTTITVEPGGFYVLDVTFTPTEWQLSPRLEKKFGKSMRCRMRAIYAIEPSEDARKEDTWTGTVSSSERVYTIWP
ncbi:hypothetical protein GCM10023185_45950 [Hymenobacter saemangeumensis]|uniref:Uncharacterized protein n=2 Tax=Hymenobacter saemangeumensis TaxID=1084522 RepID=A0ABP8IT15_9BACT